MALVCWVASLLLTIVVSVVCAAIWGPYALLMSVGGLASLPVSVGLIVLLDRWRARRSA